MKMFLASAVVALIAIQPAAATERDETQVVVPTADLDLTRLVGVKQLHQRVNRAARTICGAPSSQSLADQLLVKNCMASVRDNASAEVANRIAAAHQRDRMAQLTPQPSLTVGQ